jgi:hypothetical protein
MYVPLGDVRKLRSCYLAAKRDPRSVFVYDDRTPSCPPTTAAGSVSFHSTPLHATNQQISCENASNSPQQLQGQEMRQSQIDTICSWRPVAVLEKYKADQTNKLNQLTFFHHIANFVANQESGNNMNLVPAAYLNVEVSADQVQLLKPMQKYVMMGSILKDLAGKGAYQLIAKRRIGMIDGNIDSYSRLVY